MSPSEQSQYALELQLVTTEAAEINERTRERYTEIAPTEPVSDDDYLLIRGCIHRARHETIPALAAQVALHIDESLPDIQPEGGNWVPWAD
jgi:hypothetical protein